MATEDLVNAAEDFKDIALGELNDLSFDMESPLLTEELNGKSLVSYLMDGLVERGNIFDIKKQHKGLVLLATQVQTAGPVNPAAAATAKKAGRISKKDTIPIMRNFAIVRVPELHAHIPSPDMRLLMDVDQTDPSGRPQLSNEDKVKLSMHDAFFSSPTSHDDMPQLKSGDIVMLDGDGTITKLVEPASLDSFGRKRNIFQRAFDWATASPIGTIPPPPSGDTNAFIQSIKDETPDIYSDAFLVALAANAQIESSLNASAAGDPRNQVGGNGANAIFVNGGYKCSHGYWQFNICAKGGQGQLFLQRLQEQGTTGLWPIAEDNKEAVLLYLQDVQQQFDYMAFKMPQTFGAANIAATEFNGLSEADLAVYWAGEIADKFENCKGCANPDEPEKAKGRHTSSFQKRQKLARQMWDDGLHLSS
jgi:hypothetical protein